MEKEESELLLYAFERFNAGEYDAALEAFILAYGRGYEPTWVLKNIYDCYMSGNEETFRTSFGQRQTGLGILYDACILDFIPYKEGEYYIFDKEKKIFCGIFSVKELEETRPHAIFEEMEFSPAAVALDWDFRKAKSILTTACERKIYMVCCDMERCLSFWKIPELREYLDNIQLFCGYEEFQTYFHENTSVYLPRVVYGNEEGRKELARIREEEHQYRLTPEGRNTENVLLTIAIPTANRGNLLLERMKNLLTLPYDAEVEIAITKNCNQLYEEEYEFVSKIADARIHYYDHGKDIGFLKNWHYAVEMSCGKYVMLISDEDDVIINALEHYLKFLSSNPELSVVRPRSTYLYRYIKERKYGKKGWDAFDVVFLTQSHFPGMIVRRKDFLEADLLKLERYQDNLYYKYYPHEWWCIMLSQRGDCAMEPVALNDDSHPVCREEEWDKLDYDPDFVPGWKPYEARIGQFLGMVDFLQKVIKVQDSEKFEYFLERAIGKTTLFFEVTRATGYDPENYPKMIDKFAQVAIEVIMGNSILDETQKKIQLANLGNWCAQLFTYDTELEQEIIK